MRTAIVVAIAVAALTSIPLLAQEAGVNAQSSTSASANAGGTHISDSNHAGTSANAGSGAAAAEESSSNDGKVTYTPKGGAYGDQAASHAWEMSSISGELENKLDSKTAKAGDRVVLKTIEKVQTSDGTLIPRGSRLIGHVTEVQAWSKEHGAAQMGIAFDRVEMKGGQNVAIFTLIKGLTPSASAMAMGSGSMDNDGAFGAPMGGSPAMGGAGMGGGRGNGGLMGGAMGGAGGTLNGAGGMAGGVGGGVAGGTRGTVDDTGSMAGSATGGVMDRTDASASTIGNRAGAGLGSTDNAAVNTAGHGDMRLPTGAHAAAAERAIPHPTRIPGVMLAGNATASGLLLASRKNIELESGTQMQLGIVAQ